MTTRKAKATAEAFLLLVVTFCRGGSFSGRLLFWDEGEALDGDLCAAPSTIPGGEEDYGDFVKATNRRWP
jgi:hypothetical protein